MPRGAETITKEELYQAIERLPSGCWAEAMRLLEELARQQGEPTPRPPYRPIALGGLWKGITFSEETIAEARREMWGHFGGRDL